MAAIDCVSALRRQHMVSFDCPSAYLQGQQQASEQVLARPPPGFRTTDERGVAVLWLMNNPLYGQLDAGAIWNRTFNEFVTRQGPPASTGTSANLQPHRRDRGGAGVKLHARPQPHSYESRPTVNVPLKTRGVGGAAGHDWICP